MPPPPAKWQAWPLYTAYTTHTYPTRLPPSPFSGRTANRRQSYVPQCSLCRNNCCETRHTGGAFIAAFKAGPLPHSNRQPIKSRMKVTMQGSIFHNGSDIPGETAPPPHLSRGRCPFSVSLGVYLGVSRSNTLVFLRQHPWKNERLSSAKQRGLHNMADSSGFERLWVPRFSC